MIRLYLIATVFLIMAIWAWRALNPRPALIFIVVAALILGAAASTFGMGLSHWSYRQNQRSTP